MAIAIERSPVGHDLGKSLNFGDLINNSAQPCGWVVVGVGSRAAPLEGPPFSCPARRQPVERVRRRPIHILAADP